MPQTHYMSLEQRCALEVDEAEQQRGKSCFRDHRVLVLDLEDDRLTATVLESEAAPREVCLDWSQAAGADRLLVSCDCPRFDDLTECQHVWATLLAADREGIGERIPGESPLFLEPLDDPGAFPGRTLGPPLPSGLAPHHPGLIDPLMFPPLRSHKARPKQWRDQLRTVRTLAGWRRPEGAAPPSASTQRREAWFLLSTYDTGSSRPLAVLLHQRQEKTNGELGKVKRLSLRRQNLASFNTADRELLELFLTLKSAEDYEQQRLSSPSQVSLPPALYNTVLPRLAASGHFALLQGAGADPAQAPPLAWDPQPWSFVLELEPTDDGSAARLTGRLRRGDESRPVAESLASFRGGLLLFPDTLVRLSAAAEEAWLSLLRDERITVPTAQREQLLDELWDMPVLPRLELPPEWAHEVATPTPRPCIALLSKRAPGRSERFRAEVSFDYDGLQVPAEATRAGIFDSARGRIVQRDAAAERAALARLTELGVRRPVRRPRAVGRGSWLSSYATETSDAGEADLEVSTTAFPEVVHRLIEEGWLVEAEGRPVRRPAGLRLSLATGIDWFEVAGDADFGDAGVGLPKLLAAVRRGSRLVRLDDGSQGMLPADWLKRYAPLAQLAHGEGEGGVRFLPTQTLLLDALLEAEPRFDVDRPFERLRQRLRSFDGIEPVAEPAGFRGELRAYQRDGLGWLRFLRDLGFGGCLADDMGLGKTVQVLALLQSSRLDPPPAGGYRPSLIVVPRSVVHNWLAEAARFTPSLRTADYAGPGRKKLLDEVGRYDLVVTTYGILRRDIVQLKDVAFDTVVLDEAQAIKNPSSQAAKASRLLRAGHRLALTGTPVENHLGELWSIFEFLNPGLLGRLPALGKTTSARAIAGDTLAAVAKALRPFILRRTKEEVLDDLPEKTEQTFYCELGSQQRRLYNELRDHYRHALAQRLEEVGLKQSKIQVLEALLRLRQAACHPGLIDGARAKDPSAKLDDLMQQLEEVLAEGHKALVFSQFTSLLGLLRPRLDKAHITYEYLDGRSRNRQQKVERFQNDADCPLFLISLKAGGLGLNLTAASYVYLLDPWWNPAVEAQAVDRAHRIGQKRPVFAYRLICRDTVEEKIVKLQRSKRELADAILKTDGSLIQQLTAEDLKLLLS